jgi:photosystem II stability/assembly factor-like uncharacterized protein
MRTAQRKPRRVAAWIAAVVAAGAACSALAAGPAAEPVVTGTAHQALFSVALDGAQGLAVGAGGEVLTSTDGGQHWQPEAKSPTTQALLGVALAGDRAIAVGQAGLIYVRAGSGAWSAAASGTEERLFGVDFNASGVAAAVGAFGKILRSTDGGATWASIAPSWPDGGFTDQGLEPHLYAVDVAADGTITCVGEFGLVLRSGDAGVTWQVLHKGEASLFALDLRADGVGYAVGQGGTILRTVDGGATWLAVPSGSQANLLGVHSSADGRVVVTAMRDLLASDDGVAWHRIEGGDFGSAWYSGVVTTGSGASATALIVGHSGRIVRIGR